MRAVILGGSGFIGTALSGQLLDAGWQVVIPSRNPEKGRFLMPQGHSFDISFVPWDGQDTAHLARHLAGADAVINLAGESIADGRWSGDRKSRIRDSRIRTGQALMAALRTMETTPSVLVQGSAVGYYGARPTVVSPETFSEFSSSGEGFLASVARDWEASTKEAESMGIRRVIIRTGVVLGIEGGALPKFLPPFRFYLGGPVGSGNQGISWIHRQDAAGGIMHLLQCDECVGPYNLTAPTPVSMTDFCDTLGRTLRRPSWLPVPGFVLRLLYGEMAEETILQGQYALPNRLADAGYQFRFPDLANALAGILTP